jgi:ribonuclease T
VTDQEKRTERCADGRRDDAEEPRGRGGDGSSRAENQSGHAGAGSGHAEERNAEDARRTSAAAERPPVSRIAARFRGFLPVAVDVETGGFNAETDALLEIAAVLLRFDEAGNLELADKVRYLVKPFPGARLEPASLEITGIDPYHPLRPAMDEGDALRRLFNEIRKEVKTQGCNRAVLVGHNSFFDLQFLNAAVARANVKRNPFHPFSSFDTATLAGVAFGQTVLSRAVEAAGLQWDETKAHSALYDAEMAALIFCEAVNRFRPIFEGGAAP